MTTTRLRTEGAAGPPLIAVALISAAALAYEILLMRLFSIVFWYHFAYMIISLALLGYGAAGALLTMARSAVEQRFAPLFSAAAAAFGVSAIGCFALAQRVPFSPLEILWDPRQPAYLLAVYLLLALPFLCSGACVCMTFSRWAGMPSRIYSFDTLGAGAGCLGIIAMLFVLSPQDALMVIGALGWLAAAVAWLQCGDRRRWPALPMLAAAGLCLLLPQAWVAPTMSPYKELSQTLRIPGTRVVEERFSPLGLVSVVESPQVPLRHAPGLSLTATVEPPPQLGVFIDGEGLSALTRFDGRRDSLSHLDQMTSALPYHLLRHPRVLVLGAGAGADVLQARYHDAERIDAVELNPQVVDLVRRRYADYAGGIYAEGLSAARCACTSPKRAASSPPARNATTSSRWRCSIPSAPPRLVCTRCRRTTSIRSKPCRTICGTCTREAYSRSRAGSRCRRAMRSSSLARPWRPCSARAWPTPHPGWRWCAAGRRARCSSRTVTSTPPTSRRSRPSARSVLSMWPSIPVCALTKRTATT